MLKNSSFATLATAANNLWHTAKSFYTSPELAFAETTEKEITDIEETEKLEQELPSTKQKPSRLIDFKRLLILGTIGLFNATRNQAGLNLGLAALFADSVNAAYPTVVNPIPTHYVQLGQMFSYDIDLNYVFNDADGDILTFGGFKSVDGNDVSAWIQCQPERIYGKNYANDAQDIDIYNDIAYVANGNYGFSIFNISQPTKIQFLGSLNQVFGEPLVGRSIKVKWPYAYVASNAIYVIDVSEPRFPMALRTVNTASANFISDITLSSKFMFVQTKYAASTQIFSIAQPESPTLLSVLPAFEDVAGTDTLLYTINTTGFYVYDLLNASVPNMIGFCNTTGNNMAINTNHAFVISDNEVLQVVDLSTANAPNIIGSTVVNGYFSSLAVNEAIAVVISSFS